eukprot:4253944-Pyramimonas_sp.AAC.1
MARRRISQRSTASRTSSCCALCWRSYCSCSPSCPSNVSRTLPPESACGGSSKSFQRRTLT